MFYEKYIEVFGGGGWILFGKPLGNDHEIFNDANSNISNLFYCVREHSGELIEKLRYVLNCREDFERIKHIINEKAEIGDIQRLQTFTSLSDTATQAGVIATAANRTACGQIFRL